MYMQLPHMDLDSSGRMNYSFAVNVCVFDSKPLSLFVHSGFSDWLVCLFFFAAMGNWFPTCRSVIPIFL